MQKTKEAKKIVLTDNTVENIRIMAPYLDETSQNRVFGMMLEAVKSAPAQVETNCDSTRGVL